LKPSKELLIFPLELIVVSLIDVFGGYLQMGTSQSRLLMSCVVARMISLSLRGILFGGSLSLLESKRFFGVWLKEKS
jgi:hypothetical protein